MKETKITYNLSRIMKKAGSYRRHGKSKSTAMILAWIDERSLHYVDVKFPKLNKNNTITENNKYIKESSNIVKCEIKKIIKLENSEEYVNIACELMKNNPIWENIGGRYCSQLYIPKDAKEWSKPWLNAIRTYGKTYVVKVICKGKETFYVNTEGYDYARYVGVAA
jgi:hypothetical protein